MGISMSAEGLLVTRMNGKTPAGMVIATLVPELDKHTDVFYVGKYSDFRGFHMLDVCVASASSQMEESIEVINGLLNINPKSIIHWAIDTGRLASVYEFGEKKIMSTASGFYGLTDLVRKLKCK